MSKEPDRDEQLKRFIEWIKTIERDELERWLTDAFWKEQLEGSDLLRNFKLHLKSVDMRLT